MVLNGPDQGLKNGDRRTASVLRLLCPGGEFAIAEPSTLRCTLLHTSARLVRGRRRRTIEIPQTWPWAHDLQRAISLLLALPAPI
ncbi:MULTISPECIES: hypothetical protein [unclassified Streptosporangium]|uniref:hypothetical protein n=1 Tax=unclassified Streptosporangium TaxID=2632669 RepID=UPI002E27BBF9|nr:MULTISPECIES: hypothetical protein [unclassified Streptosporangium]